ncbi:arginase family protein [Candidatus Woesearchaeota archaeon]|nr:arginase family protein [Candidatus Woesearchaeota archaeon]
MRVVKCYPGADEIVSKLSLYRNEEGRDVSVEVSSDENKIEDSIVLRDKLKYPSGYGLVVVSSRVDDKLLDRRDAVFLGVSNYSKARDFSMKKITQLGLGEVVDLVMERAMGFDSVCLSINLDVLDKAFSSDGAIGGMTTRELIYAVQRLKLMKNLRTVEMTGENIYILAKLIRELA